MMSDSVRTSGLHLEYGSYYLADAEQKYEFRRDEIEILLYCLHPEVHRPRMHIFQRELHMSP